MVEVDVVYEGALRCEATHGPSGTRIVTDPPVDNHGQGTSYSPTDMVAAALGTCMATIMGINAKKHRLAIEGTRINVKKSMTTSPPRRIAELAVHIDMPLSASDLTDAQRRELEHAANTCPVRLSLLDAIAVPVVFAWP